MGFTIFNNSLGAKLPHLSLLLTYIMSLVG